MNTVNNTLTFNQDIEKKLEKQSQRLGLSVNTLITVILENELNKEEEIYVGKGRYYNKNTDFKLFDDFKFYTLKTWLLTKATDQQNNDRTIKLLEILKISNQIFESRLFSTAFKGELEKVTSEINRHITKRKLRKFTFPTKKSGFDYFVLCSEIQELQSILDRLDIYIDL
jgi:hypothetical protein